MLILAGLHNEPGGYLAADNYVNISLLQGNLVVIPRGNFNTIIHNNRGISGDMNRKFSSSGPGQNYDDRIVEIIKNLIDESDIFLNLHDGWGFYSDTYESKMRNPVLMGQSIIADADSYFSVKHNRTLHLGDLARRVCEVVNKQIDNPDYHFHFNNHRTSEPDSRHKEQKHSATYYALTKNEIPAFGIETSKNLPSLEMKVRQQTLIINAFMKEFDIEQEYPTVSIEHPELRYMIVSINENSPVLVPNEKFLEIYSGDVIEITDLWVNAQRGLSVDIIGYGTLQDYRKKVTIYRDTDIIIRKDQFLCGRAHLRVLPPSPKKPIIAATTDYEENSHYFIISYCGQSKKISPNDTLALVKGETLSVIDITAGLKKLSKGRLSVNFYGFVPPDKSAEDRGYLIDTGTDLLRNYSVNKQGHIYQIRVEDRKDQQLSILSKIYVKILEPQLDYILVKKNSKNKLWFHDHDVFQVSANDRIEIVEVKTNLPSDKTPDIKVNCKGFVGRWNGKYRNMIINVGADMLKRFSLDGNGKRYVIEVSWKEQVIGLIYLDIVT